MRKIGSFILFAITATSVFVSCSKKNATATNPITGSAAVILKLKEINSNFKAANDIFKKAAAKTTGAITYTNSDNPYDLMGFYHNQFLDTLETHLDQTHDTTQTVSITEDQTSYQYTTYMSKSTALTAKYFYDNRSALCAITNEAQPASYAYVYNNINNTYSSSIASVNVVNSGTSTAVISIETDFCNSASTAH